MYIIAFINENIHGGFFQTFLWLLYSITYSVIRRKKHEKLRFPGIANHYFLIIPQRSKGDNFSVPMCFTMYGLPCTRRATMKLNNLKKKVFILPTL